MKSKKVTVADNPAIKEFMDRRFGMFIHWGVYSILGGEWKGKTVKGELGEWVMNYLQIPVAEYEKIAAGFNPAGFDADELVKLAYDAGMRYIVITAKHHDGFAMYRSQCDRYNIYDWTEFKRDVIAELAAACKKYDMKLGLYYSQALDWHEEHAGGWEVKPFGARESWGNTWDFPDNSVKDFSIYFKKKVLPQVKELLTNYGEIFLMWFDTPRTITKEQSEELYRLVKELQPNCLVNSRIGNGKGDYTSLEDNQIPTVTLEKPHESPITLNDTWGYRHDDHNWKSANEIIHMLVKLASKNVNFLLNVGPTGDGHLPAETIEILKAVSGWMAVNSEAVHNTTGLPVSYDFTWGYATTGKNKIYLCFKEDMDRSMEFNGLITRVRRVYALNDNKDVAFTQISDDIRSIYTIRLNIPKTGLYMPVFVIECEDMPEFENFIQQQNGTLILYPLLSRIFDGKLKEGRNVLMGDGYQSYEHLGRIRLDCSGVLTGWSKCSDYIEWETKINKPGSYRLEIITNSSGLSDISRDQCEVLIELSNAALIKTSLKKDYMYEDSRTSEINKRIGTVCGTLKVDQTGLYTIRMKLGKDLDNEKEYVALVALKLILLEEDHLL